MSESTQTWDVIVVGAGPAGCFAARQSALGGAKVLLLEKKLFPRPKVCGTCLNRHALDVLESVGLHHVVDSGIVLDSFLLGTSGRTARLRLPEGIAISRSRFDELLMHEAQAAGVTVMQETTGEVLGIEGDFRQVRLSNRDQTRTDSGRMVILATGLTTKIDLGHTFTTHVATNARLGAACEVSHDPDHYEPGTIYMAAGRHGYVGLTRVEANALNIAAAFDGPFLKEHGSPALAAGHILAEAGFPEIPSMANAAWLGTIPLTRTTRPVAIERLMLIGDATGYVEPFTGEGMAWGLSAGLSVANFVIQARDSGYRVEPIQWIREFDRRIGRRQHLCRALARLLRFPLPARVAFEAARLVPDLAGVLVASINRPSILSHAS